MLTTRILYSLRYNSDTKNKKSGLGYPPFETSHLVNYLYFQISIYIVHTYILPYDIHIHYYTLNYDTPNVIIYYIYIKDYKVSYNCSYFIAVGYITVYTARLDDEGDNIIIIRHRRGRFMVKLRVYLYR